MVYTNGKLHLNNMERASGGITKHIGFDMATAPLVADDVVILGALPRESITLDMRLLVHNGFDDGGFELGYYQYNTGTFVEFATVLPNAIDTDGQVVVLAMPTVGQLNPDGTQYIGPNGGIWNGDVETVIALRWTDGTPTVGDASLMATHTYYGTKDGKYGGDYVPMTPYEEANQG